ncbi:hypothetical protein AaE_014308, partial [Aphanomyces astaci]
MPSLPVAHVYTCNLCKDNVQRSYNQVDTHFKRQHAEYTAAVHKNHCTRHRDLEKTRETTKAAMNKAEIELVVAKLPTRNMQFMYQLIAPIYFALGLPLPDLEPLLKKHAERGEGRKAMVQESSNALLPSL